MIWQDGHRLFNTEPADREKQFITKARRFKNTKKKKYNSFIKTISMASDRAIYLIISCFKYFVFSWLKLKLLK